MRYNYPSSRNFEMGLPAVFTHNHVEYVSTAEAARRLSLTSASVSRFGLAQYWPLGRGKRGISCYYKLADVETLVERRNSGT